MPKCLTFFIFFNSRLYVYTLANQGSRRRRGSYLLIYFIISLKDSSKTFTPSAKASSGVVKGGPILIATPWVLTKSRPFSAHLTIIFCVNSGSPVYSAHIIPRPYTLLLGNVFASNSPNHLPFVAL